MQEAGRVGMLLWKFLTLFFEWLEPSAGHNYGFLVLVPIKLVTSRKDMCVIQYLPVWATYPDV